MTNNRDYLVEVAWRLRKQIIKAEGCWLKSLTDWKSAGRNNIVSKEQLFINSLTNNTTNNKNT